MKNIFSYRLNELIALGQNLVIMTCPQEKYCSVISFARQILTSNVMQHIYVVAVGYPTPSKGWGHGGRSWSPRSRATPQGLDQRS